MPALRKSGGGVMEGTCPRGVESDLHPIGVLEGGRHPGFRERVALRGVTLERGPRSVHEDGGNIQPAVRRIDDTQGCSRSSFEEGNLRPRRSAAAGGGREGPSLGATRPAQSSAVVQRPSPQTVVGSLRRPQAAFRSGDGFRGLVLRRACSAVEPASEGLSRFAAFVILLREGKAAAP